MKNQFELKDLANEMFVDDVFNEVISLLNEDIKNAQAQEMRAEGSTLDIQVYSWKTLYLGDRFYNNLAHGKFLGEFALLPNYGDPKYPFSFRKNDTAPYFGYQLPTGRFITPQTMNYDGGSIPLIFRIFKSLTPTYFIPAYLIHDWLFKQHRESKHPDSDFTFKQTAEIMASAIKTIMESGYREVGGQLIKRDKDEDILYLIYLAVLTPFAKKNWKKIK